EDGIRDFHVTGVQTCALPILYDDVTGLPTRRVVVARTNEAIDEAQSNSKPMAIVAVVVDGFKEISNTFGRVAAEDALSEVGGRKIGRASCREREAETVAAVPR